MNSDSWPSEPKRADVVNQLRNLRNVSIGKQQMDCKNGYLNLGGNLHWLRMEETGVKHCVKKEFDY